MTDAVSINDMRVHLKLERAGRVLRATMLISKPPESDPLRDDTVALIIEAADGRLLRPTDWPVPGVLPEAVARSATANANFEFALPRGSVPRRAIAVIRGDFAEIDVTGERL